MNDYHEPPDELDAQTRDFTRALNSLKEEIEAIAWYQERIATSDNEQLKAILGHNRDEEMEHAAMSLEWLRRNMANWDTALRTYLFTSAPIQKVEQAANGETSETPQAAEQGNAAGEAATMADLKIGSLRK